MGVMALESLLAGRDYVCTCELPAVAASVRFLGPFQGRQVAWNMTLCALQGASGESPSALPGGSSRSFMEVAAAADGAFALTVGLNLAVIDEPTIRKTLVMVRKFKRLELGRHEWGEASQRVAGDTMPPPQPLAPAARESPR